MSVDNFAGRNLSGSNFERNFSDVTEINGIHFVSSESKRRAAAGQTHESIKQKRLTVLRLAHRILYSTKTSYIGCRSRRQDQSSYMRIVFRLILPALACLLFLCAILFPSRSAQKISNPPAAAQSPQTAVPNDSTRRLRLNTLGVAYLNQQRSAEAQKLFEQALQADPKFAVARLNLGIALLNQQKAEAAHIPI
jgi:tetratricopeptide (TPR) repeat protein